MDTIVVVGAGLDVHKKTVVACVINGQITPPQVLKRTFRTFLHDLELLREWLLALGCTHVAMESTGVYWLPVYRVLEGSFTLLLGNARHMANVPGRKTDLSDAEWIATLLRYGLIRPNFVPPAAIRQLRQLTRFRRKLIQTRTSAELRVQKLLEATNIKLGSVASEVFGVSGRLMLQHLAAGVTDSVVLAALAKGRLRPKIPQLRAALTGSFTEDDAHLLTIQLQAIEGLEQRLADLDRLLLDRAASYDAILRRLQTVPGIHRTLAMEILAEIGTDVAPWPTVERFAAWAGLAPGNKQSANKRYRTKSREGNIYLKSALSQAATSAIKTDPVYLGRTFGRICARRGEAVANLAIAHELLVSIYFMLQRGEDYRSARAQDPQVDRDRKRRTLIRKLEKLGYQVTCSTN